jgi:PEP-CTERM motif-containing protein
MKSLSFAIPMVALLSVCVSHAQSTFIYDQQSSTDESPLPYGAGAHIQQLTPYGQSFTPNLPAVGFIRLNLNDNNPNNGQGVTLYLNLRANSISGTVLATTLLVNLPNAFTGTCDFLFASEVSLTPSAPYTFELVIQSGDSWNANAGEFNYPGGMVFAHGVPAFNSDLWFREGIVPEPSSAALALLGGVLVWLRRRSRSA